MINKSSQKYGDEACGCHKSREDKASRAIQSQLAKLIPQGERLLYRKGQILFYQDHLPYGFYFIEEGEACFRHSCSQAGDILGLYHFLKEKPYCDTCEAKTDLQVIFFSKSVAHQFLQQR